MKYIIFNERLWRYLKVTMIQEQSLISDTRIKKFLNNFTVELFNNREIHQSKGTYETPVTKFIRNRWTLFQIIVSIRNINLK